MRDNDTDSPNSYGGPVRTMRSVDSFSSHLSLRREHTLQTFFGTPASVIRAGTGLVLGCCSRCMWSGHWFDPRLLLNLIGLLDLVAVVLPTTRLY